MGDDLRDLVHGAAPAPTRPLDMGAVARRARRLGYLRTVTVACAVLAFAGATTFVLASDRLVRPEEERGVAPAAPGDRSGGTIVFAGQRDDRQGALFTVDPEEGAVSELFADADLHQVGDPSWSGSGARIAFHGYLSGEAAPVGLNSEVFLIDANGSDLERVTEDEEPVSSPAWAPDGSIIAYGRADDAAAWELWMVRPDGYDPHRISSGPSHADYAWSPDSRHLAFSEFIYGDDGRRPSGQAIFVMNVNTGHVERLTPADATSSEPAWSPDGSRIAYLCNDGAGTDVCVMQSDGKAAYELYETRPGEDAIDDVAGLAWSPDGTRLLFATRGERTSQLMTVSPDVGDPRPLGPPQRIILGLDW